MKKILFFIISCLLSTTQSVLAKEYGKIFLQHNGDIVKIFSGEDVNKAINAATDGDTLFLSKGFFNGEITINKSISLIGSGSDTKKGSDNTTHIGYGIYIGSQNDNAPDIVIEGIYFATPIYIRGNIHNLVFNKCTMQSAYSFQFNYYDYVCDKLILDRCSSFTIFGEDIPKELIAKNCTIQGLSPYPNNTSNNNNNSNKFINCNIQSISENTSGIFINSIINNVEPHSNSYLGERATLINTLYHVMNGHNPMDKTTQQDCWSTTETLIESKEYSGDCLMNAAQLKAAGYLGVDGTVVGIEGGVNPYSLTLHTPSIHSKSTNIDVKNKNVTINVNVTTN